jgi:c(7)-type cytochrome triheme protein
MNRTRFIQMGILVLVLLWVGSAVCADRGLNFSHAGHDDMMKMPCKNCHAFGAGKRSMPNHQLCSICHEVEEASAEAPCSLCHAREDNSVDGLAALFVDDVAFDHEPHQEKDCSDCHRNAEELKKRMPADSAMAAAPMAPSCDLCHPDPDAGRLAADPAMPFCVECHRKMGEARSDCTVCHESITRETIPSHHAGVKIAHDDLDRWATEYAEVLQEDPVFCGYCHDEIPQP